MTDLSFRALFAHQSGPPYVVTGQFDGVDLLNGGKHRATDVGNFGMDDPILSPIDGQAQGLYHFDTAQGIRFRLSPEYDLELWHLNATLAPLAMVPGRSASGPWQEVRRGQTVGRTGNSGARLPDGRPMPAHTHIVLKHNGVPVDVERHLLGAPLSAGTAPQEDTMRFGGAALKIIDGSPRYRLTVGAHFREKPDRTGTSLAVLKAGTLLVAAYSVDGEALGGNDQWLETRLYVGAHYVLGYIHTSVVERVDSALPATPAPIGPTAAEIKRLVDEAWAHGQATGAGEAKPVRVVVVTAAGIEHRAELS